MFLVFAFCDLVVDVYVWYGGQKVWLCLCVCARLCLSVFVLCVCVFVCMCLCACVCVYAFVCVVYGGEEVGHGVVAEVVGNLLSVGWSNS